MLKYGGNYSKFMVERVDGLKVELDDKSSGLAHVFTLVFSYPIAAGQIARS